MIDNNILKEAIELWGTTAQIDMIIEECLELSLALQKLKRSSKTKAVYDDKIAQVVDEIADVKIMLAQAEQMFPKEDIDKRVKYKMNRLKDRIDNHKNSY